jgi:hypothetical protein
VGKTSKEGALLSLLGNLTAAKLQSFPEIYNSNAEISYNTILLCSGCCKALQPSVPLWTAVRPRNLSHQAAALYGPEKGCCKAQLTPINFKLYFAAFGQLLQPSNRPEDGCPVLHLLSCKTQPLSPALAPSFSAHAQ